GCLLDGRSNSGMQRESPPPELVPHTVSTNRAGTKARLIDGVYPSRRAKRYFLHSPRRLRRSRDAVVLGIPAPEIRSALQVDSAEPAIDAAEPHSLVTHIA